MDLHDRGFGNGFLDITLKSKATATTKQINGTPSKSKVFVTQKTLSRKSKDSPQNGRKVFANHVSDKSLVSRIYKELLELNNKKTNNPIFKWTKAAERPFSKEDLQMANKHIGKTFHVISGYESAVQTTVRSHSIPIRLAIMKNIRRITSVGKEKRLETSYISVNGAATVEKSMAALQNVKHRIPYDLRGGHPRGLKTSIQTKIGIRLFIVAFFIIAPV